MTLRRLAASNHFELSDEEMEGFQTLMPDLFASYDTLEKMPEPHTPLKYPERDPGYRPSRQDDPYNAIIRRCTLRGASSGKLAGKRFGLKNNISVAGMPMTCGSLLLDSYIPDFDATIVTRLLDAGADIVATLNLGELRLLRCWRHQRLRGRAQSPQHRASGRGAPPVDRRLRCITTT